MADLAETPAPEMTGQAEAAAEATTVEAPVATDGQGGPESADSEGQAAEAAPAEDTFFDPRTVPPELQPAYKQLQGSYTRKMQELSELRRQQQHKIQAYDQFEADPVTTIQRIAGQMGYQLTRAEARAVAEQQAQQETPQDWQPQTWEEVLERAEKRAEERLLKRMGPVMETVQRQQAQSIEAALDDLDPSWRDYEDEMRANLQQMPALAQDIKKLYKLSVPDDVLMSRATQKVLAKLESKTKQAAVGGGNKRQAAPVTRSVSSFDDAVAAAREQLARGG